MSWARLAAFVRVRPRLVLAASLLLLVAPALAVPATRTSYDPLDSLPDTADSVEGFRVLAGSFPPGEVQPLLVVVEARRSVWTDQSFAALDQLTMNLRKLPNVAGVRSITRPAEGPIAPEELQDLGLGGLGDFRSGLRRGANGLGRAIDGLVRIRAGLRRVRAELPRFNEGFGEARVGIEEMGDGIARIRDGLGMASEGLEELAGRIAEPTQSNLERAWRDLKAATVAKSDPVYPDLARRVGTALALVSGRCPDATGIGVPVLAPASAPCRPGERIAPGYEGLAPTLREVADGLRRADGGLARIDAGLAELSEGLGAASVGIGELRSGMTRMIEGLDLIVPGLNRLHRGLVAGLAQAGRLGGLIPSSPEDVALTASIVEAFPKLRSRLAPFTADRGRATRLVVTLDRVAYEDEGLDVPGRIHEVARLSLARSPLEDARVHVAGTSAIFADVRDISGRDLRLIVLAVVVGIFLVLVLLLRSLVAPIYLVLTVLLSFLSTLGLTTLVFQGLLGQAGIEWWVPPFVFVVLVALGADYNIFLVSRIREEAERTDTREAVQRGLALTGGVITSAGLILAGTFAALMASPLRGLVQMGFAATIGILLDTFVVRTLLVPSIAVLAGRHSWWPARRAQAA